MDHRAGWRSSESHLSAAGTAALSGLAFDHSNPPAVRVAAIAGVVLVSLGYAALRTLAKAGGPLSVLVNLLAQWSTAVRARSSGNTPPSTPSPSPKL